MSFNILKNINNEKLYKNKKVDIMENTNEIIAETIHNENNLELNKTKAKKKIKLTPFEFAILAINLIVVTILIIINKSDLLEICCLYVQCFAILTLAKGLTFATIVNAVYDGLFVIVAFQGGKYGDVFAFAVMLIIDIVLAFVWKKDENNENDVIKINKIGKKEWIIFSIASTIFTIGTFIILNLVNTESLISQTISTVLIMIAYYFLIRKSSFYSLFFALFELVEIYTYLTSGDIAYSVNFAIACIIEFYGFINLEKERKKQMLRNNSHDKVISN